MPDPTASDGWRYVEERRWWGHDDGRRITDAAIAADRTRHPRYTPPPAQPTIGEQVLGFAYGSDEAKRQRLDGALYHEAVAAALRAQRG